MTQVIIFLIFSRKYQFRLTIKFWSFSNLQTVEPNPEIYFLSSRRNLSEPEHFKTYSEYHMPQLICVLFYRMKVGISNPSHMGRKNLTERRFLRYETLETSAQIWDLRFFFTFSFLDFWIFEKFWEIFQKWHVFGKSIKSPHLVKNQKIFLKNRLILQVKTIIIRRLLKF